MTFFITVRGFLLIAAVLVSISVVPLFKLLLRQQGAGHSTLDKNMETRLSPRLAVNNTEQSSEADTYEALASEMGAAPKQSAPKKKPGWVALTRDEQKQYLEREKLVCGKPFQHCCIGQGRQLLTRHKNVTQLYIKWSEPLTNITTLLDYMSQHEIPCNLWFFGMSLSGDQTTGAMCELMRDAGYELDTQQCVPYANPRWNEKDALNCTMSKSGMPTSSYYQLTNPNRSSCPRVTLAHSGFTRVPTKESQIYYQQAGGGVMIMNHGVHCSAAGCVTAKLKQILTEQFLSTAEEDGWKVLYRETERQHFATPDGYYRGYVSKKKCQSIEKTYSDYRNKEARTFLHNLTATTNRTIPIIPLARATEPLHFMHGYDSEKKVFDCTHYVYSPWRFELTWDGILQGLKLLK